MAFNEDLLGWAVQDDPNQYRGDFSIKKKVGTVNSLINAIVITNKANGQHSVYEDNGALEGLGTELYNYNPDGNVVTIKSEDDFNATFTGINANQFDTVVKNTKTATLALAKDAVVTNDPQSRANLTRLVNTTGFKSIGKNIQELNPNEANDSLQSEPRPISISPSEDETIVSPNANVKSSAINSGTQETLRYPRQSLEEYGYDYIQITAYDYVPSGLNTSRNRPSGFGDADSNRFKNPKETIQLPMQPQLSEATAVSWGGDTLNEIQRAGAGIAAGFIQSAGEGKIGEALSGMASGVDAEFSRLLGGNGDAKAAIIAYFAGQAVGANVLGRTTGQVINPNLELLFTGPNLRSFNFNFTLTPRDAEEARIVRKMIRAMKRNMTPRLSDKDLFLKTPRIFELEYIFGDNTEQHPYMNKFKPCACTNFTVNYTPDGSYMTYRGEPSMTSYQLAMSFGEIEPIYSHEYENNERNMGF